MPVIIYEHWDKLCWDELFVMFTADWRIQITIHSLYTSRKPHNSSGFWADKKTEMQNISCQRTMFFIAY